MFDQFLIQKSCTTFNLFGQKAFQLQILSKKLQKTPFLRENMPILTADNIGRMTDPIGRYYRPILPILSADISVSVVH